MSRTAVIPGTIQNHDSVPGNRKSPSFQKHQRTANSSNSQNFQPVFCGVFRRKFKYLFNIYKYTCSQWARQKGVHVILKP